uniref:Uncharacterized protein n=1 Tax=Providencia stuartii TaxID=588 RepID=A0AAI9DBP5_PROST|nr:hypothetical protein [Providencia stuartii]
MTKQEKETICILQRQIQQSLEYIESGRIEEGRLVAVIIEHELGKLLNKSKK